MGEIIATNALRTILAYILLLTLARFMGRKMLSQMTFFDFVVGVTVGSVTANLALGPNTSVTAGTTVLVVLALVTILIDFLHIKSFLIRKIVQSEPVLLIENGKIIMENMHRVGFSLEELTMELRKKSAFNIADVEVAIIEHDGNLSVLLKSQKQPVTPSDLNLPTPYKGLTKDIIIDGNIMQENLADAQLTEQWLTEQLASQGISDVQEVFYAGLDTEGNLYVSKTSKTKERHGQHGIE